MTLMRLITIKYVNRLPALVVSKCVVETTIDAVICKRHHSHPSSCENIGFRLAALVSVRERGVFFGCFVSSSSSLVTSSALFYALSYFSYLTYSSFNPKVYF